MNPEKKRINYLKLKEMIENGRVSFPNNKSVAHLMHMPPVVLFKVCPSCERPLNPEDNEIVTCTACDISFYAEDQPSSFFPVNRTIPITNLEYAMRMAFE